MENTLAVGETLIKSWDYSEKKTKEGVTSYKTNRNLSVTNKRIIARETNKFGAVTQEILLNDVKGVSGQYAVKRSFLGLIVCIIFALVSAIWSGLYFLIVAGIFIFIGILLYAFSKRTVFSLNFVTYGHETLSMTLSTGLLTSMKKKKNSSVKVKVYVDLDIAREIVNTIGAIILENKEE